MADLHLPALTEPGDPLVPALAPEPSAESPDLHPDGLLGVLRTLPPDTLASSFWGCLDGASRRTFRASCREADAWARTCLLTHHATVQLNAHYLEALGCLGRPLLEHLPALRSLTLRQATAGRKPLPAEVVAACLDLLTPQHRRRQQPQEQQEEKRQGAEESGAEELGGCGEGAGVRPAALGDGVGITRGAGGGCVRRLALVGWPSLEVAQLALVAAALPRVEELELVCRTRAFPHNFVAPGELLPALPDLLPRLRQLRLAGLGLQHHAAAAAAAATAAAIPDGATAAAAAAAAGPYSSADGSHEAGIGGGVATAAAAAAVAPAPTAAGGLAALSRLRCLTRLQLSTVDLPRRLAAQLGGLTQLRELELELWLVMTPADELRGWARAVGRGVGALAAAAAATAVAAAPGRRDGRGEGAAAGQLRSLRLQLRNCVEEVGSDEEARADEADEDEEAQAAEALEAGWRGAAIGHAGRGQGASRDGGSLMAALLAALATAVERGRHRHRPPHQHQQHQQHQGASGGGAAAASGAHGYGGAPAGGMDGRGRGLPGVVHGGCPFELVFVEEDVEEED
eukprot:XP_001690811.1 predicted protein [Chlamydomonas reinhardtii]